MIGIGEVILSIFDFLTQPTWHLVIVYVIALLIIAVSMLKSWGFK